jgi:hypothetical protein
MVDCFYLDRYRGLRGYYKKKKIFRTNIYETQVTIIYLLSVSKLLLVTNQIFSQIGNVYEINFYNWVVVI